MRYRSTRGTAPELSFTDTLLAGLASDGGLYVPVEFPKITPQKPSPSSYAEATEDRPASRSFSVGMEVGEGEWCQSSTLRQPSPPTPSPSYAKSVYDRQATLASPPLGGEGSEKDRSSNIETDYSAKAAALMQPYVGDDIPAAVFAGLVRAAYASFSHAAVTPLVQLDDRLWLLELFHGPTLAFKDIAMQLLGQLFTYVLGNAGQRLTIVAATSGDTGAAAVEAFKNHPWIDLFILLPLGRISAVQQRQMTTSNAENVHVVAVEGTFDECQKLVKSLFADEAFRQETSLSAVNSINWVRIMAQTVYYAVAASAFGDRQVRFAVPTGNFGNVYAGHAARAMGVPVADLLIGTNSNDALVQLLAVGQVQPVPVVPTLSPAMDIQIPSNFERLLFELYAHDGRALAGDMAQLKAGQLRLTPERLQQARSLFKAARVDDALILRTIAEIHASTGQIIDPHTAVGVAAARLLPDNEHPTIALATAHPAKFPEAVQRAIGRHPPLPEQLQGLLDRPEVYTTLPPHLVALQQFIRERRTK